MKFFRKPLIILGIIIFIAAFLRLTQLGKVPASLNWDEVSLGYNAYSILLTGRDEYGEFLPVVLRSFDDYKPALYAYFDIPFIATLGMTEVAVRLPSAVMGILAVALVYFLVIKLLSVKTIEIGGKSFDSKIIALLSAFFLAISPWHIQFSRIGFESNVGLTLNILAFLLFLIGLKRKVLLPLAFMIASLNLYMYQSDRVFSPLLMIALLFIFRKQLFKIKKWLIISIIASILVALPLLLYILTNQNALLRAKGVSVFSEKEIIARSSEKLIRDDATGNVFGKLIDNRRVEFGKSIISGYISHFSPNWLFLTGDLERHHAPYMGILYIFQLPLILIGLYSLIFLKINRLLKASFFTYFLLVPIPASITSGVPHAVRTLNFAWTFEFMAAIGALACVGFVLNFRKKIMFYPMVVLSILYCLLSIINFSYYLNQYFVQLNIYSARDWLYGYKQAIAYIEPISSRYDHIVVENEVPFDQSYMFFLFYLKVDPAYYQSLGGTKSGGYKEKHRGFYNFTFEPVSKALYKGNVLYMGKSSDLSGVSERKVISYPNGEEAIVIGTK